MIDIPKGYYKQKYGPLNGSDWLRALPKDERQAFAHIGFAASGYGVKGGEIRALTAKRDSRGRFV